MTTTPTFCRICEAACGLTYDDETQRLRPDRAHPLSHGFICAKGTRFTEVADHPSRILQPLVRRRGALERASWDEALEASAAPLREIIDRHGPHAVGIYVGNPLAFHAAGQFASIFFGRALGTRNVFTAGSQDCNNKFAAAAMMHGTPAIQPIPDFERAELAVCFGTNPAVSQGSFVHLEGGSTIFDRMIKRGARVIWVDVRETESAARWGELRVVRPGSDVWLILALLGLLADGAAPDARVVGLDTLLELARQVTPARASHQTGLSEEAIVELAEAIDRADGAALHLSVGVNQGQFGTLSYVALQALAYVTGNFDARGGSLFSSVAVTVAKAARAVGMFTSTARSRVGDFPTVFDSLPAGILADEILTEGAERIRAMVVIAGDPLRSVPGAARLREAFGSLESLTCIDLFESLTARTADVILPTTSWLERADLALPGLPLSTLDLLQTTSAVRPRPGATRGEHEILAGLSRRIGRPLFGSALACRAIESEGALDALLPRASRLVSRLLDRDVTRHPYGVPVPAPEAGRYLGRGPLTPEHRVRFWHPDLDAERARLFASEGEERSPLVLIGRRRRIGHNSWLHGGTREGRLDGVAWMSREEMEARGLEDGAEIEIETSTGRARLPVYGKEGVRSGTLVVPHGELDVNVNELLPAGPEHIERISGMLRMTGVPVRVL